MSAFNCAFWCSLSAVCKDNKTKTEPEKASKKCTHRKTVWIHEGGKH